MSKKDKVGTLEAATGSLKTRAGKTISTADARATAAGKDGGARPQEGPERMELTFSPTEDEKEQEAIIEAILSTTGNSTELHRLTVAIGQGQAVAEQAVERLTERYRGSRGGMKITQLEGGYQICAKSGCYGNLIRVAAAPKKQVLTEVVLRTLSIIAYKQPVTKMEIKKIRGVESDHAVNRLVEYNLVYGVDRLNTSGRPTLFATTEEFLGRFEVGSVQDLPDIDPEQEAEIKTQVEEELQLKLEETGSSTLEEAAATKEKWRSEIPKHGPEEYNKIERKR